MLLLCLSSQSEATARCDTRIRASTEETARSVQGNWRAEHLFALQQALDAVDFVARRWTECDTQIEQRLQALQMHDGEPAKGKKRGRARNAPKFDLRTDKPKAVAAAAHRLARLIYTMLTKGEEYTDQGQACYEERYRQRVLHNLNRRAQQLGMALVPAAPAALAA
jgi:hypothetical protein